MKVCYFGGYDKTYPRTRILMKGLKKNGVDIAECNSMQKILPNKFKAVNIPRFTALAIKHAKIKDYDAMVVGYPGWYDVSLAKYLAKWRNKDVIFDAFISLYETLITDNPSKRNSLESKIYWQFDRIACSRSDLTILVTHADMKFFSKEFKLPIEKFRRVFLGTDEDVFYPRKREKIGDEFVVYFHGTHIPTIHGIENIIKAAKILEKNKEIKFKIQGYTLDDLIIRDLWRKLKPKNIELLGRWVPYEKLPSLMTDSDICLGTFGTAKKVYRYIPNKIFEAIAMKKPLINQTLPTLKEAGLKNYQHLLTCNSVAPKEIAEKILLLKEEPALRNKIAKNGYSLFKKRFTTKVIGKDFKNVISELL